METEAEMIFEPKARYLSLHGSYINQLGDEPHELITADLIQNREDRDQGGHHVTVVNHLEILRLMPPAPGLTKKETKIHSRSALKQVHGKLIAQFGEAMSWEKPVDLGVGRLQDGEAITYYKVLCWPWGQTMRGYLGLGLNQFHVTMGFTPRDVHLYKGPATLVCLQSGQHCTTEQLHVLVRYASYYYHDLDFLKKLLKACLKHGLYGQSCRIAIGYILSLLHTLLKRDDYPATTTETAPLLSTTVINDK